MSGIAPQATQAGLDALAAYAKRVKPDTLRKVGDEILAVGELLSREPRLRRALTDPARDAGDRARLTEQVLNGKVTAGTLKIVSALVAERWSSPGEILTGVEVVGVDALLTAGAAEGVLAEVEDELFRFQRVVEGDGALSSALSDVTVPVADRAGLASSLLSGKAKPITIRLVEAAIAGYGGRGFDDALSKLVEGAAAKREQRLAYVTVASPLPEEQEARLAGRLSEIYGQPVSAKVTVDPQVVGGIKVQIGHDLYDGTVARRLSEARKALVARR
ncbi:MAG TPA: F0F1 ATP synthase subunit delta [Stackebrandtia sp.]|jgi:F-type H+-transporting ATPase subunit delta|nr:F0F1 ATP synthase subunit delta [Stackebrandtia sp.]HZE39191.1 F0F1 ATP synthase subunit delta [Stackebrandtia sp.]